MTAAAQPRGERRRRPAAATPAAAPATTNVRPSYMVATNQGGRIEAVPSFNAVRARSEGFRRGRVPPALRERRLGTAGDIEFAHPQFTFGADDRVPVADPSALPWRCVCQLVIEGLHGREVLGTGWLAGPRTVVTAGHNLLSFAAGLQATRVWVLPARTGDAVPYGFSVSTRFDVHPRWRDAGERVHDVGVIWLEEPVGERVGWFGIGAYSDQALGALLVNNAGYPADKPLGTMWFNAGRILQVQPKSLTYGLDTEPGQSGSPIFHYTADEQRIVVAVHAYGDSGSNIGVRITDETLALLSDWIR